MSCFGQKPRWLTSWLKGVVLITSGMDERDERKRTSVEASKCFQTTSKLGFHYHFRKSMAGTYQLAMRCPVYRRRDSHLGSRTELENLAGDAKGESTSGEPARLKVPMRRRGADCFVVVMKRGNACGAKEAGHRHWVRPTGNGRSLTNSGRRQPSCDGTSRMNREVHVRNL